MNAAPVKDDTGELDLSKLSQKSKGAAAAREEAEQRALSNLDGRRLRRKNRTVTISWKVKPETKEKIHRMAEAQGMTYVEALEWMVECGERELKGEEK